MHLNLRKRQANRTVLSALPLSPMKKFVLLSLPLFFFSFAAPANAAFFMAEEELTVVIPLNDDTYIAGGMVQIEEYIEGDLFLAGGEVTMKADVEQDLLILGGEMSLSGEVGDDMRVAGGKITLSSEIGDDLMIFGGEVTIAESATIYGDVRIFGGEVVVNGAIEGDLYVRGGSVKIDSEVEGDIDVRAESLRFSGEVGGNATLAAKDLHISNTALFEQDVHYWQPEGEYYFAGATVQGLAEYDEALSFEAIDSVKQTAGELFIAGIVAIAGYALLSSALIILILILATKTYFTDAAKRLQKAPGVSLWYGVLYLLVTPFIALFFLISVIGMPVGLFIGAMYIFSIVFARPLAAVLFTRWIQLKYDKKWKTPLFFVFSVCMYVGLRILSIVPLIGSLLSLISMLMMFGALGHTEYQKYKKVR